MKKSLPIKYRNGRVVKVGDYVFGLSAGMNRPLTGLVMRVTKTGTLQLSSRYFATKLAFAENCIPTDDVFPTIRGS